MNPHRRVAAGLERRSLPGVRAGMLFAVMAVASVLAFALAPQSPQDKVLAVLHGLSAQRPSQALWFDGERLPLGARMTGLYGGCLVGQLYLLLRGRLRAIQPPSLPIAATLGLFIVVALVDELNSLAYDLSRPTAYPPTNTLRLATGALAGTTLGVVLWLLVGRAVWAPVVRRPLRVLRGWGDLIAVLALTAALCLADASGWRLLFAPLALLQVVAAVLVLLVVCLAVIEVGRGSRARHVRELTGPACGALVAAYLVLLGSGTLRNVLEAGLHLKPLG